MGPALAQRSAEIERLPASQRRGYASVADRQAIDEIHRQEGVHRGQGGVCPHAAAGAAAAARAQAMAAGPGEPLTAARKTMQKPVASQATLKKGRFDYAGFYGQELDKKHRDKSYRSVTLTLASHRWMAHAVGLDRYFNNINRMAAKFPVAHTEKPTDEVTVWCANDYLGMGRNPMVLETMKLVGQLCIKLSDC